MTSAAPDSLSSRITAEILDGFDEELEMELDDGRLAAEAPCLRKKTAT